VGDYPLSPPKAHGFGASIYPAFTHFVSLWGGVFYFLGMALSVTDALFGFALWRSIFCCR
jgi:hypothetical protein